VYMPDPIVGRADRIDPAHKALLADSVGLALLVVLETLGPAERLAFVLHDMFAVSFDEIASIVGHSPSAARQLASRARRRVRGAAKAPDVDLTRQREVVDAFLAAARGGDFDALLAVLDPDIVLRADRGAAAGASRELRGARVVAEQVLIFGRLVQFARPALVNGAAGVVAWLPNGQPFSVMGFTVKSGRFWKSIFSAILHGSISSTWRPRRRTPTLSTVIFLTLPTSASFKRPACYTLRYG
jgi:Sigma-70, region 4